MRVSTFYFCYHLSSFRHMDLRELIKSQII